MALPPQFKSLQHHLRTAQEHEKRDPVVAYYCESSLSLALSPLPGLALAVSLASKLYSTSARPGPLPAGWGTVLGFIFFNRLPR